ncbi:alpha/beta hydrolase [Streptomyces sp. NBC_01537]|uniref:alpha/beta fold hydrolase n=1 Tax=Streptomyces sp. NBC_01537 TaxID=2903896 RepID=UPI00386FBC0D
MLLPCTTPVTAPWQAEVHLPDGARLTAYADGPQHASVTVVLVHGLSVTSALWRTHVPLLVGQGFRVVRYDQRAHGRSTRGTTTLSLDQLADDLAHLIDHVAPHSPLVLAGHSMGAMTLMRLVTRRTDLAPRIRGLLLLSAPYSGISTRTGTGPGPCLLAFGRDLLTAVCTHAPGLVDAARRLLPNTSRWALRQPAPASADPLACRQGLHAMATADIAELWLDLTHQRHAHGPLRQLGDRVHLMAGGLDTHIPAGQTRRLAAMLPSAQLEIVPDAAHSLPVRHARLVTHRITRLAAANAAG